MFFGGVCKNPHIPYLRIFVSSPGDVNDERQIALDVIEQLPYHPTFRDKVAFRVIAWDKPAAGTPMRATLTPQEAINQGLPMPAKCDIVVVLFWSRMGTPFEYDGEAYQSGTHFELLDAVNSKRADTVIYRRTQDPQFKLKDPEYDEKVEQYRRVESFFESDFFYDDQRRIKRGYNSYETPDDFRRAFEIDLATLVLDALKAIEQPDKNEIAVDPPDNENITTIQAVTWPVDKSPFPGLRAFAEDDAPIFFGRGRETDALVEQLKDSRFVGVVGASGSGKSSLVGAGLIPRLRANAIPGSKDWQIVRFNPDDSPFIQMADSLIRALPSLSLGDILKAREDTVALIHDALDNAPDWTEVLLFVDQFEELFTLTGDTDREAFVALLDAISQSDRVRAVVTMRSDFYHRAVDYQELAEILRDGSFPLAIPKRDALRQMIERPAERAGLTIEDGLVERILDDTGHEPGNLALMAYALDELYKLSDDALTHEDYDKLGGVQGAIGTRAENQFKKLDVGDDVLQRVFHMLVEVDERGTATRRRATLTPDTLDDDVAKLIEIFTDERLLTTSYDNTGKATVEVAHEAILRSWPRLAEWIEDTQDDLRLLRQVRLAAQGWDEKDRPKFLRWPQERLEIVYAMIDRLQPGLSPLVQEFIEPEQERLYRELENINTTHQRRFDIGERLARIGDTRPHIGLLENGLPDIDWLYVAPGGKINIEGQTLNAQPFYIARYLITYAQFQAFVDDDYGNPDWWQDLTEEYHVQSIANATNGNPNAPRDSISWYQSVAFSRWLDARLREAGLLPDESLVVRLPAEQEWQWAAQNGRKEREYPWGTWDEQPRANTTEAGINDRSTAVGMYPHGAAVCGALDMAGNLREWCLNEYSKPENMQPGGDSRRVLRGGSFPYNLHYARCASRNPYGPNYQDYFSGLRVFCGVPVHAGR